MGTREGTMTPVRLLLVALLSYQGYALPSKTDAVVPEFDHHSALAKMSAANFIGAMTKSGNNEADCRAFGRENIDSISAEVLAEQGVLDALDTGAGCAAEGQDEVTAAQAHLAASQAALGPIQTNAAEVLRGQTHRLPSCVVSPLSADYATANAECVDAINQLTVADGAVEVAHQQISDAQTSLNDVTAEAARMMSGCHCRVQTEQLEAWAAASSATASRNLLWKKSHEVLCGLDQASTCNIPTCPTVTQPTVAAGVNAEDCSQYHQHCLRITTGTGSDNDGDLTVEVTARGVTTTTGNFASGVAVLQRCYSVAPSLQVRDHTVNAWTGSFEYSSDGGSTYSAMICSNCGAGTSAAMVVFDGNADGANQASTQCLNGATCAIAPASE